MMDIYKQLLEASLEKKIVSVFTDEEDRSLFTPGYVDAVDETWVRIKILDNYGVFDGYGIRPLTSVVDIETESEFEKSLKKLLERNPTSVFPEFSIENNKENILIDSINYAFNNNIAIAFWDVEDKEEYIGSIESVSNGELKIRQLKSYGIEVGTETFKFDDVFMLDVGGNMERSYLFLNESR